jgi:selenocysteine-specific elongation factor
LLARYHAEHPLDPGAPSQWLRSRLGADDEVASGVLDAMGRSGIAEASSGVIRLAGFAPTLTAAQRANADALARTLRLAGAEPPSIGECAVALNLSPGDVETLSRWLAREGILVQVEPERFYAAEAVAGLKAQLAMGMTETREYAPSDLREMLGLTRKFLIPFLEYCDREGYTIRAGLGRRLAAPPG